MSEWQVGVTIGQILGTLGAIGLFVRNFKAEFEKFRQEHYKQIESIRDSLRDEIKTLQDSHAGKLESLQREHYRLREEIAEKYLKRDEWLSHHNKLEAQLTKKLETIEELLRRGGKC